MSREDVIRQIVARDLENLKLTEEFVSREVPTLYDAACEYFGTWETALRYAGINERAIFAADVVNTEPVLRQIRKLCLHGYGLSSRKNLQRNRELHKTAKRLFGSWKNALRAVGMNLEQARPSSKPRNLSRDKIVEALRQRLSEGLSLTWSGVCLENRTLAVAAKNQFRSWTRALEAAGIPSTTRVAHGKRKWNRETVLEAIRVRQREGKSLQCSRVREEQSTLVSAARSFFPTWREAVEAAIPSDSP